MEKVLKKLVEDADNRIDLYKAPIKAIKKTSKQPCAGGKCRHNLNIIVVAAPCHGFGDVVFASKFAKYLRYGLTLRTKGYSTKVTIVTPTIKMFQQIGVKGIKLVELKGKQLQCRRLKNYSRPQGLGVADLIFVAPLMQDFEVDYNDVRGLLKESTPFNTVILSEYQSYPPNSYDLATGIGEGYYGLLFDSAKPAPKPKSLNNIQYALAYIAKDVGISYCMSNFIKMVSEKYYKKYKKFQIVIPEWSIKKLKSNISLIKHLYRFYPNIYIRDKITTIQVSSGTGGTLILRGDILPVSRDVMLGLMKGSVNDILVTGDQSLTDVIDCCPGKTIWYQTVPWKKTFAQALSEELPQKYISNAKTSCGTLKAINFSRGTGNFKARNDFRKIAKHQLDSIFRAISEEKKKGSLINRYLAQLKKSANKNNLIKTIDKN